MLFLLKKLSVILIYNRSSHESACFSSSKSAGAIYRDASLCCKFC